MNTLLVCDVRRAIQSSCSIQIGYGLTVAPAGPVRNTYLVVTDLEETRRQVSQRGIEVGEI